MISDPTYSTTRVTEKTEPDSVTQTTNTATWDPRTTKRCEDIQALYGELERLTPDNETLLRFAETHPPDSTWLYDDTDPFMLDKEDE